MPIGASSSSFEMRSGSSLTAIVPLVDATTDRRTFFAMQASMFATFHMLSPAVFYNREDQWEIPTFDVGGNPTPMQVAVAEKKFADATGWDIEWRKFNAGPEVIAAMASGDVKVAELGSSPLAIAASQGVDPDRRRSWTCPRGSDR